MVGKLEAYGALELLILLDKTKERRDQIYMSFICHFCLVNGKRSMINAFTEEVIVPSLAITEPLPTALIQEYLL